MDRNVTCKTNPVQRAAGQSAVAAAAYRAAERLQDARQERMVDFSPRARDVRETLILAPEGAPAWASNREALWNRAEAAERRVDGRPARDVILGFAWELPPERQREAAVEWARREFVDKGHVVDLAFHRYGQRVSERSEAGRDAIRRWAACSVPFLEREESAERETPHVLIDRHPDGSVRGYKIYQPHAHCLVTPRAIDGDGFAAKRNRDLDRAETAKEWRYKWPKLQNRYLAAEGIDVRVLATARGDGHLPLRDEYLGLDAYQMQQRGVETHAREAAEFNRAHNDAIRQAAADSTPVAAEEPQEAGREPESPEATVEPREPLDGFLEAHRAAQAQAAADLAHDEPAGKERRLAAWWQNLRQSFSGWRQELQARAGEYWHRHRDADQEQPPPEQEQEP